MAVRDYFGDIRFFTLLHPPFPELNMSQRLVCIEINVLQEHFVGLLGILFSCKRQLLWWHLLTCLCGKHLCREKLLHTNSCLHPRNEMLFSLFTTPLYLPSLLFDTRLLPTAAGTNWWFVPSKHLCTFSTIVWSHVMNLPVGVDFGAVTSYFVVLDLFSPSLIFFFPLSYDSTSSETAAFLLWSYRTYPVASGNTVLLNTDEIATNPLRSGV